MARALGYRVAGGICFAIGTLTIVGIPLFWPLSLVFLHEARKREKEAERKQEVLEEVSESLAD